MKNRLLMALAIAACAPAMLLAEGSAIIDTTAVNTNLTQLKTDLSGWVTSALPILLGIAGAFLLFWLVKFAIRLIKSFSSSAK